MSVRENWRRKGTRPGGGAPRAAAEGSCCLKMSCSAMVVGACTVSECCVTSWIITSQFLAPLTQAPSTLLQCYMIDEEYFAHDAPSRFAEKEMHTWVDTYGGEHASYTDVLLG